MATEPLADGVSISCLLRIDLLTRSGCYPTKEEQEGQGISGVDEWMECRISGANTNFKLVLLVYTSSRFSFFVNHLRSLIHLQ